MTADETEKFKLDRFEVRGNGSYIWDSRWRKTADWQRVCEIPKEAAFALIGEPLKVDSGERYIMNKLFVVYAFEYDSVYAVYNHDGIYSIIKSTNPDFARKIISWANEDDLVFTEQVKWEEDGYMSGSRTTQLRLLRSIDYKVLNTVEPPKSEPKVVEIEVNQGPTEEQKQKLAALYNNTKEHKESLDDTVLASSYIHGVTEGALLTFNKIFKILAMK